MCKARYNAVAILSVVPPLAGHSIDSIIQPILDIAGVVNG